MHRIADEIHNWLPNQTYLTFVTEYLLGKDESGVDPFALMIPDDKIEQAYVSRGDVDAKLRQQRHKIIIGPPGSGKTTLWQRQHQKLSRQTLVVSLPLTELSAPVAQQELLEGKVSYLTPKLLLHHIFDSYWEHVIYDANRRGQFLPGLRLNKDWMMRLRWFYHYCRPLHCQIFKEFELMTWLDQPADELFHPQLAPEDALRALIEFISADVWTKDLQERSVRQGPYISVRILVDGTERLSNSALKRFMYDVQKLYDLSIPNLYWDIFVDAVWQNAVRELECVKRGYVPVYTLLPWKPKEVKQLLSLRLQAWGSESYFAEYEGNWAQLIPQRYLDSGAQKAFINVVLEGAARAAKKKNAKFDLPIQVHALKLARGLIAACANEWLVSSSQASELNPLSITNLDTIVEHYCQGN